MKLNILFSLITLNLIFPNKIIYLSSPMSKFTTNKSKETVRSPNNIRNSIVHFVFFWLRIWSFFVIYILAGQTDFSNPAVVDTVDDFVYIIQFNLFQIYFVTSAIVSGNIFGFYLSIGLMVHNAALSMFIPATTGADISLKYWSMLILIAALFVLEAVVTLFIIYTRRLEINFDLFKKVGANPKINDAFGTRKCLEAFGSINVFVAVMISAKFFLPPSSVYNKASAVTFGFTMLTFVEQLFISVGFNEENIVQRKIALFLSFLKIPVAISAIVMYSLYDLSNKSYYRNREIVIYLLGDTLLITICMNYLLVQDTRKFGSGLKDFLKFKTRKLNLS